MWMRASGQEEHARHAAGNALAAAVGSKRQASAGDTPPRPSGRDNAAHSALLAAPITRSGHGGISSVFAFRSLSAPAAPPAPLMIPRGQARNDHGGAA
jgi:hypothetical protein